MVGIKFPSIGIRTSELILKFDIPKYIVFHVYDVGRDIFDTISKIFVVGSRNRFQDWDNKFDLTSERLFVRLVCVS